MKPVASIRPIWSLILLGAGTLSLVSANLHAQAGKSTTQALLDKAYALEVRGRLDMAAQTWQQVLLTDPNNVDALAGLARAAKLSGNNALAGLYLDRLHAIKPGDTSIQRIESMDSQQSQSALLQQAEKYAQAGQYAQAMTIYRKAFGDAPPPGDWALAYYETEAATLEGRAPAIAGLRELAQKFPNDARYPIALGRILTYSPATRSEGRRYLDEHSDDPQAADALRQSLLWDASSPGDVRAYLAKYDDPQLAETLRKQPKPSTQKNTVSQTPEKLASASAARADRLQEQAAYNSLNANRLDDAERRFTAILANEPENARALAGMGYVRMQQSNYGAAVSFLERAKRNGARDAGLDNVLETARIRHTMRERQVEYQRQQIARLTGQAQSHLPITLVPQEEIYGPYVPYVAPVQTASPRPVTSDPVAQSPGWGYTPTPVRVQLGGSMPHNDPPQKEITDVLPTARYLPNAGIGSQRSTRPMIGQNSRPPDDGSTLTLHNAQYKPQGPQPGDSFGQQYPQPGGPSRPRSRSRTTAHRATSAPAHRAARTPTPPRPAAPQAPAPTVVCAPSDSSHPAVTAQSQGNPSAANTDLLARSIPPSGPYEPGAVVPSGPVPQPKKTEPEISSPEEPYSAWVGATGYGLYRGGTAGIDRLIDLENSYEASAVLGDTVRLTVVPRAVYLHSGAIDTTAFKNTSNRTIPVLGTLPANALVAPQQQFASGVGGELQLTTANIGLAVGYTPYNFLVSNVTGHAQWRPLGGPVTVFGDRDSVRDTQLSYAGLRDPGSITPLFSGKIWGGVVATGGGVRFETGNERARINIAGSGSKITGYHVLDNRSFDGSMAASFRVRRWPGHGSLSMGVSLLGMHYDRNERGMTYGRGGYFSPNSYFQAGVPLIYDGYHGKNFNYVINGSVGVHTFQEERAPYYPLDLPLQTASGNAFYPQTSVTGATYSIDSEGAYRVADHWYIGGFLTANNTRNYNMVSGGFFVRYLFKPQVSTESAPKGLFPTNTSFRPLRVP